MNYKQYIEQYVSNPHIVSIFTKLFWILDFERDNLKNHYGAIKNLIYCFKLFNDFPNNKNKLLALKDRMFQVSNKNSKIDKFLFDYAAALNSIIAHYEPTDPQYPIFKIGVKKSLKFLKKQELLLAAKVKECEQDSSSLGKRKHLTFFAQQTHSLPTNTSKNTHVKEEIEEEKDKVSASKNHKSEH